MRQKKGFVLREVCGEQVLVGEGTEQINFNKLITLNDTAAFLWEEAEKGEFTVDSLTKAITDKYDVDEPRAKADVESIIEKWLSIGIIEK